MEVYFVARVQVNLKLDEKTVKAVEKLVEEGRFENKTQAFMEALRLLLMSCKAEDIAKRIDEIREGTEKAPSVTKVVVRAHEGKTSFEPCNNSHLCHSKLDESAVRRQTLTPKIGEELCREDGRRNQATRRVLHDYINDTRYN